MDSSRDSEFDARLVEIEAAIVGLQRSVDALIAERGSAASPPRPSSTRNPPIAPRPRQNAWESPADGLSSWIASRNAEWWLSRVGIGFVVLAIVLLYGYAIDHGWITPPVRVLTGIVVGAVLFGAAIRVYPPREAASDADLGFRELLFGGGLAVWYVTAYAAAVWYQLIPMPAARLAFFVLGIVSTWIALQERREIFAVLAVATGFATPFILPAPVQSVTELSLYLGAIASIGLIIYLMRGWHSIIWITFIAFWMIVATQTSPVAFGSRRFGSVALSILVFAAGAAFTRVPLLRRQLLALGSPRYTPAPITSGIEGLMEAIDSLSKALGGGKSAPDSLTLWFLTLLSPVLAIGFLGQLWPRVPDEFSGVVLVLLGAGALMLFRSESKLDAEIAHVEVTAAMLWTVIGVGRIIMTPESLPASAALAALAIYGVPRQFVGPRVLAKLTIVVVLLSIAGHELSFTDTGLTHLRWFVSEIVALGVAAFIARQLIAKPAEEMQGIVLGAAGYFTALLILWRALEPIWAPLVTASYAVLGAGLLILSRRKGNHSLLKYLGAATMLIVAGRLLIVDLSSVETIWRVLLFLVCGAVFLYTGYRMQPGRAGADEK